MIAAKADISWKNKAGETPVDLAKKYRFVDVEFILENAAKK